MQYEFSEPVMNQGRVSKSVVLFVTAVGAFLTPFTASSVSIALPAIRKEFAMDAVLLTWVPTSYLLAAAMFLVPFARAADIYGMKRIYLYGLFIYTLSTVLCGTSDSAGMLIFYRVLQGVGGAMIFGTGVAILTSIFPAEERGKVLGINVAAVYLGLSLGPVVGGFLTEGWGWRSVFLITAPLGGVTIFLILWKLKGEWAQARGERFDFVGSATYAAMLAAVIYGFSLLREREGVLPCVLLVLAGIVSGFVFIRWEIKAKSPVLEINLFRKNAGFTFSNLSALISYSATAGVGYFLSIYLQDIKGLGANRAGLVMMSQPIVMTVLSPFAGRLSDRIEPRVVASVGMAVTAAGLFLLVFLNGETSVGLVLTSLIILGIGFGLFSSPNTNAVMSSVEKRFYGPAAGTLATMRLTGQMLSMGIAMLVLAIYLGRVPITEEYYPLFLKSMRVVIVVFVILCSGGVFASLARGKVR
jgi:EmrB/QacA subfamily drug resistance transporter